MDESASRADILVLYCLYLPGSPGATALLSDMSGDLNTQTSLPGYIYSWAQCYIFHFVEKQHTRGSIYHIYHIYHINYIQTRDGCKHEMELRMENTVFRSRNECQAITKPTVERFSLDLITYLRRGSSPLFQVSRQCLNYRPTTIPDTIYIVDVGRQCLIASLCLCFKQQSRIIPR
jgi:hypothetical protein